MRSDEGDTPRRVPGYPIRTPSDHSSVGSSPRLIAASNVLHRLLVPRHPPCALTNLTTKMLASTVQFSTNAPPPPATPHHRGDDHQPDPTTPPKHRPPPPGHAHQPDATRPRPPTPRRHPLPQDPTARQPANVPPTPQPRRPGQATTPDRPETGALLRKEVIQPHLPVRLPCYDFVPIADPAFDGSPPRTG